MEKELQQLKQMLAEISDIIGAVRLLSWDQQTYMPPGGGEARAHQLATLQRMAHKKLTSEEMGRLLEDLSPYQAFLDPDSDPARLIQLARREHTKRTKVPASFVAEYARLTARAHEAWEKAREDNDFSQFQPVLEKIVGMSRQYAEFFSPYEHIYDPLLDEYEPGMKTETVQEIFSTLRPLQVDLIRRISEEEQVEDMFLYQQFDREKQRAFGEEVISDFGYDWQRGRQDQSTHPFTTHTGLGDVRITTRFDPAFLNTGLFSTLHEAGHAIHFQGISLDAERSPFAISRFMSYAVKESQSRLYENLVGRSYPFWRHYYPRLQEMFPTQLGNVSLDMFYKGINKVEPSLIRVEADEATYNLHIMLRMELEIALMEEELQVSQLPEAWNTRMEEYLGLAPSTDSEGVLQDIHWSAGSFGYFPTYALGNLLSVQIWDTLGDELPDLEENIEKGDFSDLLSWLREHVHQHGAKYRPQELTLRATGETIDPAPYITYLESKFGDVYQLP